ncbi:hypothetical protein AVEN_35739-1 [Araneus ventricosus]|uniref:Uncharacterized protein n=1 Tax=Araneus ventricosus TaxID=182803 RepID=A0A4Y2FL25_ARAVE|nr:hypothetical protein AVEN_35739-1 [Araneus ventricosus]
MPERKSIEKIRPSSPKKDNTSKSAEKSEQPFWKSSTPIGTTEQVEALFAPYLSKALVNNVEMSILRDTGVSIDIVSRNHTRSADLMGETVWVKQPLDLNFTCLPLAKVELQSSEFGHIMTKATIINSKLDSGLYLLSNRMHNLILEAKQKPNLNAVVTRSQHIKQDSQRVGKGKETRRIAYAGRSP